MVYVEEGNIGKDEFEMAQVQKDQRDEPTAVLVSCACISLCTTILAILLALFFVFANKFTTSVDDIVHVSGVFNLIYFFSY